LLIKIITIKSIYIIAVMSDFKRKHDGSKKEISWK